MGWKGLVAAICLGLCSISFAESKDNQSSPPAYYFTPTLDQSLMVVKNKNPKTYILPATPATTQWGIFNSKQTPVLTINSGDSVSIETLTASDNQVVPGVSVKDVYKMNNAVPGRGPHTITGPIYINDAEPGDVLQIHFNKIVPRAYASNYNLPGKGLFPKVFPKGQIKYFLLDIKKNEMQFASDIIVPLAPFPGIVAVARHAEGKFDTVSPGPFGGSLDLREMKEGTTLYLPVFVKGALLWTGDSHAGQGNGKINLTAIETAFSEFNITVKVLKQKTLTWPRVETSTAWITMGYHADLNQALKILKSETKKLIMEKQLVSDKEAARKMIEQWNCPIAETVNGVKGVYCMISKEVHAMQPLPKQDNNDFYVTYAKDSDLQKAMERASMNMINKIVVRKHLSPLDTYALLSIAMDCRMGAPIHKLKEVHCMLAKNLWREIKE